MHSAKLSFQIILIATLAQAEIKPNQLFSNGAVVQQGMPLPVWGTANEGEKVTVEFDGEKAETVAKNGKWTVRLKPHQPGGPFTMTIAGENTVMINDILVGEVWVCSGQSNMGYLFGGAQGAAQEMPKAHYPKLRTFTVSKKLAIAPTSELGGTWLACSPETVSKFSAVAYYFGRDVHKATDLPVGLIHSSWGGTPAESWTSLSGLEADKELNGYVAAIKKAQANFPESSKRYPQEIAEYEVALAKWNMSDEAKTYATSLRNWEEMAKKTRAEGNPFNEKKPISTQPAQPPPPEGGTQTPTVLYNSMIAPLQPYAIRGVIWYQGESNGGAAKLYQTLFPRLITDWREQWGQGDFPFLFVQLAPYVGKGPEIREAQLLTLGKVPVTAMAVTTDVGEANDIHPRRKEPVGARLALAARALAYGEKIEYSGPMYDSMKVEGREAVLSFKHIGSGLDAKDGVLKGFTIAGADKMFVPAQATIRGETVVVSSEKVLSPTAVRYGWENVPDVNLYNRNGLPASPFRTDAE